MQVPLIQFQVKTDPIGSWVAPVATFVSFQQPWSEPVRKPRLDKQRIAVMSSGLFAPVLDPSSQLFPGVAAWSRPLETPVRVRLSLRTGLQQFTSYFSMLPPPASIIGWFAPLREPVWPKKGLRRHLQQFLAWEPRLLPTPNVTATISAIETNADDAEFDVQVGEDAPLIDRTGISVSITEIPAGSDGGVSFREQEPT